MRRVGKIVLAPLAGAILLVACAGGWLLYYSRDLPDIAHLKDFAPDVRHQVNDDCVPNTITVVPFSEIGTTLEGAVAAAQGVGDDSALRAVFKWSSNSPHHGTLSQRIAQTLFCGSSERPLHRQLQELRVAIHLDRQFSRQQLFTIYMNRIWLGECGAGVETGAQCLFQKDAVDLSLPEAALLAGLLDRPSYHSPFAHPDRALLRRNIVLDAMVTAGQLSRSHADQAKIAPLR